MKWVRYPTESTVKAVKRVTTLGQAVVDVAPRLGMSGKRPQRTVSSCQGEGCIHGPT